MVNIQGEKVPQLRFKTTLNQDVLYYLDTKSNREILKLDEQSIILPIKLEKTKNDLIILREYKVMKGIPRKMKKAV